MKNSLKKISLIILVLVIGGALAGIIQEELGYGLVHGLVILLMVFTIAKILGAPFLRKRKNKETKDLNG